MFSDNYDVRSATISLSGLIHLYNDLRTTWRYLMSGSWINHSQRSLFMSSRVKGDTQERAASRSGFSERSGRRIEKGEGGPEHRKPRRHRTRKDPLAAVWEAEPCTHAGKTSCSQGSHPSGAPTTPVSRSIFRFDSAYAGAQGKAMACNIWAGEGSDLSSTPQTRFDGDFRLH